MKDYRYSLRLPEDLAPHSGRLQEAIEHYLSLPKPKPRLHDVSGPYGQHATAWLDEQAYQIAHHAPPGWCRAVLAWHLSSTQASTGLALAPARKDKDGAGLARREMGARARNGKLTRRDLWREYVVVDALRKLILSGQASMEERCRYAELERRYLEHVESVKRRESRGLPKPDWYDESRLPPWADLDDYSKEYWSGLGRRGG